MKTFASTLIIAAATVLSASAYAADNVEPNDIPFQGVYGQQDANAKTRDQVIAELQAAKAAGQVSFGESEQPAAFAQSAGTLTRAQVEQELSQARSHGEVSFGDLEYQAG